MSTQAALTLDEHGFEVPRDVISKYLSLKREAEDLENDAKWEDLLFQAEEKQYRAGGLLPPRFTAAVRDGIPNAYRGRAWMLLSGAAARMSETRTGRGSYTQLLEAGQMLGQRGGIVLGRWVRVNTVRLNRQAKRSETHS